MRPRVAEEPISIARTKGGCARFFETVSLRSSPPILVPPAVLAWRIVSREHIRQLHPTGAPAGSSRGTGRARCVLGKRSRGSASPQQELPDRAQGQRSEQQLWQRTGQGGSRVARAGGGQILRRRGRDDRGSSAVARSCRRWWCLRRVGGRSGSSWG